MTGDMSSWVDRNDGFEHEDELGRRVRVRFSRLHGVTVTVTAAYLDGDTQEATVYLGDPGPLVDYLLRSGGRVCQVGQREPCGTPATRVIAIRTVSDDVWTRAERRGGVTFLCDFHGTTPPAEWDGGAAR